MTHRERCNSESTRDVIFLFQENMTPRKRRTAMNAKWRTVGVWMDRKEAETWGISQRHNFGDKGDGWQVYGVPSEGMLAVLLRGTEFNGKNGGMRNITASCRGLSFIFASFLATHWSDQKAAIILSVLISITASLGWRDLDKP